MGDMADLALEDVFDFEEDRLNFRLGKMTDDEAFRRGIIDETGGEVGGKSRGPGSCPSCGGDTTLRQGRHGGFFGCNAFPKCRGNRAL